MSLWLVNMQSALSVNSKGFHSKKIQSTTKGLFKKASAPRAQVSETQRSAIHVMQWRFCDVT